LDGTIATWNRAAGAIFGYQPQEVIGRSVFLLAAPGREDEMPVILDQIRRGQRIQHYETVRRHKNGCQVAISLTVSPIRADNGRIVGASKIARDITERKQAEAELRRLNETLEQRVAERTGELEVLARKLQDEIVERQRADVRLQALQSELFHAARFNAAGEMAAALAHELNQPLAAAVNFVRAGQRQLATETATRSKRSLG
jgi:PAS domain S-box-containing protein